MDFALSEEQRLLVASVRRFVTGELIPLEDEIDKKGFLDPQVARAVFEKSKALGFYAMNIPEAYGGGGLSALDVCLTEEQFGHTKDILVRRAFGNVYDVLLEGDAAQRDRWLLPAVRGERTFSIAISEPGAGSDAAGIETRARREGAGWTLAGQKHFISDGLFSDFFVVSAVTDPAAGAKGISLFLVDKDTPGVTVGRDQPMMGLTGTSHIELFFDAVRLGPEHLLGPEGQGLRLILETLGTIRLAQIGARAVGKASRLLAMMTEHCRERRQFGRPIGDFQMVQQMLADSAIEIEAARLMVLRTAFEIDRGGRSRERISMVKVHAAETLGRVADRAVQAYGGMGYCRDLVVEGLYRDARIFRIYDGTSEIHRVVVARGLLAHGAELFDFLD
jgi:acyl-CoA dehydrogenase